MPADERRLRILLVSDNRERADRIRQLMHRHTVPADLHRVRIGRKAADEVRGRKKTSCGAPRFDLVVLDFADADERLLPAVAEIAFERRKKQAPIVLLTSVASEQLLSSGKLCKTPDDLFAPLGLFDFLARAREHGNRRFLRAIRIIAKFGPVLVRLPGFVVDCREPQSKADIGRAVEYRVA